MKPSNGYKPIVTKEEVDGYFRQVQQNSKPLQEEIGMCYIIKNYNIFLTNYGFEYGININNNNNDNIFKIKYLD